MRQLLRWSGSGPWLACSLRISSLPALGLTLLIWETVGFKDFQFKHTVALLSHGSKAEGKL